MDEQPTKLEISELTELCCAIGHVVVQWGFVEHNLNFCVATIYSKYGGNDLIKNHNFPKFLKRQIEYLRDCFKKLDTLHPFEIEGLSILDRIVILSKKRDEIIHSTYGGSEPDYFIFRRFDFNTPHKLYVSDISQTFAAILDVRKKIEVLAADLLAKALKSPFEKEGFRGIFRKL